MPLDRWGPRDLTAPPRTALPRVAADSGLVLEDVQSGWVGAVVRVEKSGGLHVMALEDRHGRTRTFRLGFGFHLDGVPVEVIPPAAAKQPASQRTASGSVRIAGQRARTARASRIWVEGQHDAELVEKVWGDDLRIEGIAVEPLHGIDDLPAAVREFAPGPSRRLGILVDHLTGTSKESLIARQAMDVPGAAGNVLVTGHPYVDIWQAIRPAVLGRSSWPVVPRGQDWKRGILAGLGWPCREQADIALGWKRMLGAVHTYADLEPALLGRVEEIIDFLTVPAG